MNSAINDTSAKTPRAPYTYDEQRGRTYAEQYCEDRNPHFYASPNNDSTNFVSQCVWAAYGGWSTTDTAAQMQTNISEGKCMTQKTADSGYWFATNDKSSDPWKNAEALWHYATGTHIYGPKAIGVNNYLLYSNIPPSSIFTGHVLQFRKAGSDEYEHSVYVSGGINSDYTSIIVSQHSDDRWRYLIDVIIAWGGVNCYMRQLKFQESIFYR